MKTSSRIIILTIIIILFFTAITSISMGIFFLYDNPGVIKFGKGSPDIINKEYTLKDFDSINVAGLWKVKVEIKRAASYNITMTGPEYAMKHIEVDRADRTLRINQLFFADIPPAGLEVAVSLPMLKSITSGGSPQISFSGFTIEELAIKASGYSQVKGTNSDIENLILIGNGMLANDLGYCTVMNAHLELSGSGTTDLNINGGTLSGYADGNVIINYTGSIGEQDIEIFESAQIIKKDSVK